MIFNVTFEVLRYGKNKILKESSNYLSNKKLMWNTVGQVISEKEHIKVLAVSMCINNIADFSEHTQSNHYHNST